MTISKVFLRCSTEKLLWATLKSLQNTYTGVLVWIIIRKSSQVFYCNFWIFFRTAFSMEYFLSLACGVRCLVSLLHIILFSSIRMTIKHSRKLIQGNIILLLDLFKWCQPGFSLLFTLNYSYRLLKILIHPQECVRHHNDACSKLTIKTPERPHWRRSGVFIVNLEHISHLVLFFLLLTLSR